MFAHKDFLAVFVDLLAVFVFFFFAADAIDFDYFAFRTIWHPAPVQFLIFEWAEFVIVAEDAVDFDFVAHVLQVEVFRVLSQGPKA